jgi:hypothetical protein
METRAVLYGNASRFVLKRKPFCIETQGNVS